MKIQPTQNNYTKWTKNTKKIICENAVTEINEYTLNNGKKFTTLHNFLNNKKVAIIKTLYDDKSNIIKEKVIQFIDNKRKVTRIF